MKFKTKILALLLISFLAIGCANQTTKDTPKSEPVEPPKEVQLDVTDYFPTKVGTFWDYSGEGNEYAAYTQRLLFNQGNYVQMVINSGGTSISEVYELGENEIKIIYQQEEIYGEENLIDEAVRENRLSDIILKEPLKKGTGWSSSGGDSEIIEDNAEVVVPMGTFKNCIVVQTKYPESPGVILEFFAPNIGIIKREYKEAEFVVISDLKEFNPAK